MIGDRVAGYTDLGGIDIAPRPQMILMTDRGDGTIWLLSSNTEHYSIDGLGHISITNTIPNKMDFILYGPYDGPIITGPPDDIKLLVRDGTLGYEFEPHPIWLGRRENAPVLTRHLLDRSYREIVTPDTWQNPGDMLGWHVWSS